MHFCPFNPILKSGHHNSSISIKIKILGDRALGCIVIEAGGTPVDYRMDRWKRTYHSRAAARHS